MSGDNTYYNMSIPQVMVNYFYDLEHLDSNRRAYDNGHVAATTSAKAILEL